MTKPTRLFVLAFWWGLSILIWWPSLKETLRLALENEAYTHILLIVPLSAVLIYIQSSARPNFQWSPVAGSLLLAGALSLLAVARWTTPPLHGDIRLSVRMFALVTWWIGAVAFCFGLRAFRLFLFPLCFLFWIVPLPSAALDSIIPFLQNESSVTARVLFQIVGTPVVQDGVALDIPGLSIEVVRECSSIRSSLVLIVMTMFLAHLFLGSWWRKVILIFLAIPLSVIKNGLRIFVIAELATRVDPGFLEGNLHHHGGPVFLGVAVVIVIFLILIFRRTESAPCGSWARPQT
jgi:exosortase